eukprot:scaffold81960_cov57-Phaeocystis_antarctica.AAC.1
MYLGAPCGRGVGASVVAAQGEPRGWGQWAAAYLRAQDLRQRAQVVRGVAAVQRASIAAHEHRQAACGATVRGTYGTPGAGTCTACVPYLRPSVSISGSKLPCASGTYSTQEAGTRSPYVQHGGSGAYVSAPPGHRAAVGWSQPPPPPPRC